MKKFFNEFKTFVTRGNVLDMAVGVIVGGAFTAIVNALSNNILKPLINALLRLILGGEGLSDIYTARIYNEVKNRPVYIIKEKFHAEREDNTPDRKRSFFSLKK